MFKNYVQENIQTDDGTQGQLLIERKIYDQIIDLVVRTRIGREYAAITETNIPGSSVDIDLADTHVEVRKVTEGAAILMDKMALSSFNMKPDKYAVRIGITREMLEDGKWNLLEYNINQASLAMAYNEDSLLFADALDNATNTVSGSGAITLANITRAYQYLTDGDYSPDVMFVGPEVQNDIQNITTFTNYWEYGTREQMTNGLVGTIFGMKVVRFSANSAPSTAYSAYAYVIDSKHAYVVAEKRPITVERYDDVVHDLSGATITQRIKYRQLRAGAIAKITT